MQWLLRLSLGVYGLIAVVLGVVGLYSYSGFGAFVFLLGISLFVAAFLFNENRSAAKSILKAALLSFGLLLVLGGRSLDSGFGRSLFFVAGVAVFLAGLSVFPSATRARRGRHSR